jgi:hypothetical protein
MALTRIVTGQQKSEAAGILILRLRVCVCMPPPWSQSEEMHRERKPESRVACSLDSLSGDCPTTHQLDPIVRGEELRRNAKDLLEFTAKMGRSCEAQLGGGLFAGIPLDDKVLGQPTL